MSEGSDDPIRLMSEHADYLDAMNATVRVVATKGRRYLPVWLLPEKRREWTGRFREHFELWDIAQPVLVYYEDGDTDGQPDWSAHVYDGFRFSSGEPYHTNWDLFEIEVETDV